MKTARLCHNCHFLVISLLVQQIGNSGWSSLFAFVTKAIQKVDSKVDSKLDIHPVSRIIGLRIFKLDNTY